MSSAIRLLHDVLNITLKAFKAKMFKTKVLNSVGQYLFMIDYCLSYQF